MKLISKVMVSLSFGWLATCAAAADDARAPKVEPARAGVGCPVWMCGTNSPLVAGAQRGVHDSSPAVARPAPAAPERGDARRGRRAG